MLFTYLVTPALTYSHFLIGSFVYYWVVFLDLSLVRVRGEAQRGSYKLSAEKKAKGVMVKDVVTWYQNYVSNAR